MIRRISSEPAREAPAVALEPVAPRPSQVLRTYVADVVSGRRRPIPLPGFPALTKAAFSRPGSVSVLLAPPGSGKSLLLLQLLAGLTAQGVPVAGLLLEDDLETHLARVLCQVARDERMNNPSHIVRERAAVEEAIALHTPLLDTLGDALACQPATPTEAAAWVKKQAKAGVRLMVIDPISLLDDSGLDPWAVERDLIRRLANVVRAYPVSVILATHYRKLGSRDHERLLTLDDAAGSAAVGRATGCVAMLETKPTTDHCHVQTGRGETRQVHYDRILRLAKVRHAKGAGRCIALTFEESTLRFVEHGVVVSGGEVKGREE